jgi:hypothetical protein
LNRTNRAQSLVGARLAEHITKDWISINRIDQLVAAIGITHLIDEGSFAVGIGAGRPGEVRFNAA